MTENPEPICELADESDRASVYEQAEREACIRRAVLASERRLKAGVLCHNCGDPVPPDAEFCEGGECRADYEARVAAKRRNGW